MTLLCEGALDSIEPESGSQVSDLAIGKEIQTAQFRYKGVVPQKNGHYGAQIYANHSRIWIGTFKTEIEAAMAYDRLAMKVRSEDSYRNVNWTPESVNLEAEFQKDLSDNELVSILKDNSYPSKLLDFRSSKGKQYPSPRREGREGCRNKLFEKELTMSDVGKLNRLVIPKKFAKKLLVAADQRPDAHADMEIAFYDTGMKCWWFRFCYWKSSQSYVFTRGWNKFVRGMNLKAKDSVSFYKCEKKSIGETTYYAVDIRRHHEINPEKKSKRLRLFGVNINIV